ncbi:MAG: L,D-transpeptidase family protein [Deltaproteobacteria bacterium]|nr:L,D-transpeptidase family protein [Deltaproteobacteria bacterium]
MTERASRSDPSPPAAEVPPSPALEGCVDAVADLPASPAYDGDDPRLQQSALIVAHKSARRLMLFGHGRARACFEMGLGFAPRGHKHREGDGRTPEGWYRTSDKPWSDFPGAIAIHYPNHADATRAASRGDLSPAEHEQVVTSLEDDRVPPQQTGLGGEILIHGGGSTADWTLGCMALDDEALARLRRLLPEDKRVSLLVLP